MNYHEIKNKPHLSASAISTYIDCSLLYMITKVKKIKAEFRPDAMEFGSAIHRAVAEFNIARKNDLMMDEEELTNLFEAYWSQSALDADDIQWTKGKSFDSYMTLGKALLGIYHEKIETDGLRVLAVEEFFSFNIPGIDMPVIGFIDLVEADSSGTVIISDLKTTGKRYSNDEIDLNDQLTIYMMSGKANGFDDREILLRFDCLIKTREPKFEQFYSIRSDEDIMRMQKKIKQVSDGIQKEVYIPNTNNWRCKSCSYKKYCNDWFLDKEDA